MIGVKVTVIGDFSGTQRWAEGLARKIPADCRRVTLHSAREGNKIAKSFARSSAGRHGKHYPNAFTAEMKVALLTLFVAEYGPDAAMPQGGMSFERGSRNQPPHLDLAKSSDLAGPAFAQEVRDMAKGWFS